MGKLERVLELVEKGKNIEEISRELKVPLPEVEGMIKILESMGYLQIIEMGVSACETCPLSSVCPGRCIRFKGKVYQLRLKLNNAHK